MIGKLLRCIWCRGETAGTLEHILPESLACPPGFVTRSVCRHCNNGLGHVDQALLHEFEIAAFIGGVRRKGGRTPRIDSWAPIAAAVGADGPEFFINMGPENFQALGKTLRAARPANGIRDAAFRRIGPFGEISFKQEFGRDPKFYRAIYKVALGSLSYFLGEDVACEDKYNPVREFVRKGNGDFKILMMRKQNDRRHHEFNPPYSWPGSDHLVVGMTIFGLSFITDLDPEQKALTHVLRTFPEGDEFGLLPPTPKVENGLPLQI